MAADMEKQHVTHPFPPVWNADSRVLILGSLPSVQSRKNSFYYGHPQNRFWRMLGAVFAVKAPQTIEEKTAFLLTHRIALWDVIAACDITGSADSAIRNAVPNDIPALLDRCDARGVLLNGKTAAALYEKHFSHLTVPSWVLPSTSPANAAWSLERLTAAWGPVLRKFSVL